MDHLIVPSMSCLETDWHLSHCVASGPFVFFSGVTGTDVDGHVSSDARTQFEHAFDHLRCHLEAANSSFAKLVEMTTYHVDLRRHLDTFVSVKDRHIHRPYPAWSAIGVSQLITNGALVEIKVVAER